MNNSILLHVNGKLVQSTRNTTLLQFLETINVYVPRFCYHKNLTIAGNCRMCLVEVAKSNNKPVVSCAVGIMRDMQVYTDSQLVKKAREGILEFLLINHPLDCPICDQGGECDLQDQSLIYGSDRGRFTEQKRSVFDKNFGPLIKTVMTRCIHCTRCIRFANEVAGINILGTMGRGVYTEISTYVEKTFVSEISGNVIDLCPVGALTSKPYAFTARPWELVPIESIDTFDSLGSNIRVDTRGGYIVRILPRFNNDINDEWISDYIRFSYDSLRIQRLLSPFQRIKYWGSKLDQLMSVSSSEAVNVLFSANVINNIQNINLINSLSLGDSIDTSDVIALKQLDNLVINKLNQPVDLRRQYLSRLSVNQLEQSDVIIVAGLYPKLISPVFNIFLRKWSRKKKVPVLFFTDNIQVNHSYIQGGITIDSLIKFLQGKHPLSYHLISKNKISLFLGENYSSKYLTLLERFQSILPNLDLHVIHLNSTSIHESELSLKSSYIDSLTSSDNDNVTSYIINNIHFNNVKLNLDLNSNFNIRKKHSVFFGHHPATSLQNFFMMMPIDTPFDKTSFYINNMALVQQTNATNANINNSISWWFRFLTNAVNINNISFSIFNYLLQKNKLYLSSTLLTYLNSSYYTYYKSNLFTTIRNLNHNTYLAYSINMQQSIKLYQKDIALWK